MKWSRLFRKRWATIGFEPMGLFSSFSPTNAFGAVRDLKVGDAVALYNGTGEVVVKITCTRVRRGWATIRVDVLGGAQ